MSEIRVDNITDEAGTGKPGFPNGITATGAALTDPEITGGIYLGGTGSANYLDDYEEGTWSPTANNGGTIETKSSSDASTYIKIGRLVFVRARVSFSNLPDNSDKLEIAGLPFTIRGGGNYGGSGEINYTSDADTRDWRVNFQEGEDYIYFHTTTGTSSRVDNEDAIAIGLNDMIIGGVYETTE